MFQTKGSHGAGPQQAKAVARTMPCLPRAKKHPPGCCAVAGGTAMQPRSGRKTRALACGLTVRSASCSRQVLQFLHRPRSHLLLQCQVTTLDAPSQRRTRYAPGLRAAGSEPYASVMAPVFPGCQARGATMLLLFRSVESPGPEGMGLSSPTPLSHGRHYIHNWILLVNTKPP